MDVKSSHEKPTWHGGEFYPELIRKSMFPSSLVMEHNMLIDFFFAPPPSPLPHFHVFVFNLRMFVWAFVLQIFFGMLTVGELEPGFSLSG